LKTATRAKRVGRAPATTAQNDKAADVRSALRQFASPARAAGVSRFFKTGKGEYGEGDRFLGATVGEQRSIARQYRTLPLLEIDALLTSQIHEERLTALLILVHQFEKAADERTRARIARLYLKRLRYVNNWDLIDTSADPILGGWLADKERSLLDRLARSPQLWSRRAAIIATFYFIKRGDSRDALRIAGALVGDRHDLIHKASGWMLREVGKRVSLPALRAFLCRHASTMPRTMLRYAIEHLSATERRQWMAWHPQRLR
jgi:3-methyladenine DNA glycosylase AlkD